MKRRDLSAGCGVRSLNTTSNACTAVLTFVTLIAGCGEPTSPSVPAKALTPAFAVAPGSFDLSTSLRAVRRRNEPTSQARGTLQLQFTRSVGDPNIFDLTWQGVVQNPQRETFFRGSIRFVGDPNILPAELLTELAGIALIGDPNVAKRFTFAGGQGISDRLAAVMYEDPNEFVATLYSTEHPDGAIAGALMRDGRV